MIFGWGNGGFGGGWGGGSAGLQGALTRGDLCSEFSFNDLQNAVRGVQQGICDSTFALNNTIVNGFNGVSSAICNLGYEQAQLHNGTQMAIMQGQNALQSQIASCCCENRAAIADVKYQMATDTCAIQNQMATSTRDIIDSQRDGTRAILDWLCNKETADLRAENQALRLSASQSKQNDYLIQRLAPSPVPAYPACPVGGYGYGYGSYGSFPYGTSYNSGCGCGCGCNG